MVHRSALNFIFWTVWHDCGQIFRYSYLLHRRCYNLGNFPMPRLLDYFHFAPWNDEQRRRNLFRFFLWHRLRFKKGRWLPLLLLKRSQCCFYPRGGNSGTRAKKIFLLFEVAVHHLLERGLAAALWFIQGCQRSRRLKTGFVWYRWFDFFCWWELNTQNCSVLHGRQVLFDRIVLLLRRR